MEHEKTGNKKVVPQEQGVGNKRTDTKNKEMDLLHFME